MMDHDASFMIPHKYAVETRCAVCVAECPVNAIYAEEDVPADQQQFIDLNAELARNWPSITKTKAPLAEAEEWKDTAEKLQYLQR